MAGYSTRVRSDIARWLQAGLIDAATADSLTRDVEANARKSLSFGSILAMMAALLFGAAILIFVAANWDAIPRLARVAALFAIILGGYVGGAKGRRRATRAFYLSARPGLETRAPRPDERLAHPYRCQGRYSDRERHAAGGAGLCDIGRRLP
jgi:hypothetical protein